MNIDMNPVIAASIVVLLLVAVLAVISVVLYRVDKYRPVSEDFSESLYRESRGRRLCKLCANIVVDPSSALWDYTCAPCIVNRLKPNWKPKEDEVLPEPTPPKPSTPEPAFTPPASAARSCLSCRHTRLTPLIHCYGRICRPCLLHHDKPNWEPRLEEAEQTPTPEPPRAEPESV